MISYKELFGVYNYKSWKHNKFQICLSILSIVIVVATLISVQLVILINNAYINSNAKKINDGDININLSSSNISFSQLKYLDNLRGKGYLNYITSYKIRNNLLKGSIIDTVNLKFVNPKYYKYGNAYSYYNKWLHNNGVVINRTVADKYNFKKGDKLLLNIRGFLRSNKNYVIKKVIQDSSSADDNILGVIILNNSNLFLGKNAKLTRLATNIHIFVNKSYTVEKVKELLEKKFRNGDNISTFKDIIEKNKESLEMETKTLNLIKMLILCIAGVGISFTTFLLILKRKKDYVLFIVYGMPENMLKNLIIYEILVVCAIGNGIGVLLSIGVTWVMEKSVVGQIDLRSLLLPSLLSIASTAIFSTILTLIFTIIPIRLSKKINPISILRQQDNEHIDKNEFIHSMRIIIPLLVISFSVYAKSLFGGCMYTGIIAIMVYALYKICRLLLKVTANINIFRNKRYLMGVRNIKRQITKCALCSTILSISLMFCGAIINLSYFVVPTVLNQYVDNSGYNLSLITGYEFQNKTDDIINKNKDIKYYMKTIDTTCVLGRINGKSYEKVLTDQKYNKERKEYLVKTFINFDVKAIDLNKAIFNRPVKLGRWFAPTDKNKNFVVLGNNFIDSGISIGDTTEFNICGRVVKLKVIGISDRDEISSNQQIYISINKMQKMDLSKYINTVNLNYLIKSDNISERILTMALKKELPQVLVINTKDIFEHLSKFISGLAYILIYVCVISVISAICLIGNILMIINYERIKEFIVLNALGAKNKDIKRIVTIEGVFVGSIAGILAIVLCEFLSYIIQRYVFNANYIPGFNVDIVIYVVALVLSVSTSLIMVRNIKIDKNMLLLREN